MNPAPVRQEREPEQQLDEVGRVTVHHPFPPALASAASLPRIVSTPPGSKRRTSTVAGADAQVEHATGPGRSRRSPRSSFSGQPPLSLPAQLHRPRARVRVHLDPDRARDEHEQLADSEVGVDSGGAVRERNVAQIELESADAELVRALQLGSLDRPVMVIADPAAQRDVDRVRDTGCRQ